MKNLSLLILDGKPKIPKKWIRYWKIFNKYVDDMSGTHAARGSGKRMTAAETDDYQGKWPFPGIVNPKKHRAP